MNAVLLEHYASNDIFLIFIFGFKKTGVDKNKAYMYTIIAVISTILHTKIDAT